MFTVMGVQGHAAYPSQGEKPPERHGAIDGPARITQNSTSGTAHFDPSTLAIVTIDTGNPATNVIPARMHRAIRQHPL
jgi:succinyl-diaminopimelate desuccinylase